MPTELLSIYQHTEKTKTPRTAPTNSKAQEEVDTTKERKLDHTDTRAQEEPDPTIGKGGEQTRHTHHYHTRGRKDMCLDKQE